MKLAATPDLNDVGTCSPPQINNSQTSIPAACNKVLVTGQERKVRYRVHASELENEKATLRFLALCFDRTRKRDVRLRQCAPHTDCTIMRRRDEICSNCASCTAAQSGNRRCVATEVRK
mmetsp:Transcript_2440/g.3824  ORF Transcript_2440/g.3824 Transcript_2440/m.3824 type:complete len:119 (-) Transcript_2440:1058-1414(-)